MKEFSSLNGYGVKDKVARENIETLTSDFNHVTSYFTPQMYGAVGDGVTDDTSAIKNMIEDIESSISTNTMANYTYNDYSKVSIVFHGQYKITEPIVFTKPYALKINGLNLIAGEDFNGDSLLLFDTLQRKCIMSDCQFDGAYNVNDCLFFNEHFIAWEVSNIQIKRFIRYGIHIDTVDSNSHEFMGNNIRILQTEAGDTIPEDITTGIGLYIANGSSDNNFTNTIISQCRLRNFECNGSANFFLNCHFYGGAMLKIAKGNKNKFIGCYFDTDQRLQLDARCTVIGCYFYATTTEAIIQLLNEQVGQNVICGNQFHSDVSGTTSVSNTSSTLKASCNEYERCTNVDNSVQYTDVSSGYTVASSYADVVKVIAYQNNLTKEITLDITVTPTSNINAWQTLITSTSAYIQWKGISNGTLSTNPSALSVQNTVALESGKVYKFRETFVPMTTFKNY